MFLIFDNNKEFYVAMKTCYPNKCRFLRGGPILLQMTVNCAIASLELECRKSRVGISTFPPGSREHDFWDIEESEY